MLLFRSTDSGFSWDVKELSNGQSAPVMMTSLPGGRLFLLDVSGASPRIRWSTDGGKTLSQTHKVYWNDGTGEPKAGSTNSISTRPVKVEGSIGISLVTASSELEGQQGAIRFFPDGTSTGGRVRLSEDTRTKEIVVQWLTGHVKIREDLH